VPYVCVRDRRGELDLDTDDLTLCSLHDEVDLVIPVPCSQVAHAGLGRLS